MNCPNCGGTIPPNTNRCVKCGSYVEQQQQAPPQPQQAPGPVMVAPPQPQVPVGVSDKSKLAAGLLGIFLGSLGVHRFYLGYTNIGVVMLVLWLISWPLILACGLGFFMLSGLGIWGLVEGILALTGSLPDAQGRPLRD